MAERETGRERAREKREENKEGPRAEGTAQDGVQQKCGGRTSEDGPEGRLGRRADDSLGEHAPLPSCPGIWLQGSVRWAKAISLWLLKMPPCRVEPHHVGMGVCRCVSGPKML